MVIAIILTVAVFGFIAYKAVQMNKKKSSPSNGGGGGGGVPSDPSLPDENEIKDI